MSRRKPKQERKIPTYRLHKSSGLAVVTLSGRDVYLGEHGTDASRALYDRRIAEWLAAGRGFVAPRKEAQTTVAMLLAGYESYAATYYVKRQRETSQMGRIRRAIGVVRRLYGAEPAAAFGPSALKAVRADYLKDGLCRNYVNQLTGCVVRAFKWAVGEEIVAAPVWQALCAVEAIHAGRQGAFDHPDVPPAPEVSIEAVLLVISPVLADVMRFQLLTGSRPGEATILRGCDLDRSKDVWLYRPGTHKTEHHGSERVLYVGPKCQTILAPYLERLGNGFLFSPRDCVATLKARARARRKTQVQPSQQHRSRLRPKRPPGEHYAETSYVGAVRKACLRAKVEHFSPAQLRHNAATRMRAEGISWDDVRIILGHRHIDTTRIYAEDSTEKAIKAIRDFG